MSLGLSIFLTSILISCIYLLNKYLTKSNWKKFVIIILLLVLGIPAICFSIYFAIEKYENMPKKTNEYCDIKLGDSFKDVIFFKGQPHQYKIKIIDSEGTISTIDIFKFIEMKDDSRKGYTLCSSLKEMLTEDSSKKIGAEEIINRLKNPNECVTWAYSQKIGSNYSAYEISYDKNGTVNGVFCQNPKDSFSCPRISYIGINDTYQQVIDTFGVPLAGYETLGSDGKIRVLKYPKYNVIFYLYLGKVYRLGIYDQGIFEEE